MGLKVTIDHPDFPKDTEFGINGLGVFQNGVTREVSEAEEQAFLEQQGVVAEEGLKGSSYAKVEGSGTVEAPEAPVEETEAPVEEPVEVVPETEGGEE